MVYIGDSNMTCTSISIALCVNFYFRVFKKHFLESTVIPSTTVVKTISNNRIQKK